MLATGDERFKEKMDLDIQVSKLRTLKQSYLSEHYDLEDRILKHFPREIKELEERIESYGSDAVLAQQHKPQGEGKFCPMTLCGKTYAEKADAGEMLLAACKENTSPQPVPIGSYRGFQMEVWYDSFYTHYCLNLCGTGKYKVELGSDACEGYPVEGVIGEDGTFSQTELPEQTEYNTESLAKYAFSIFYQSLQFAEENQVPILMDF